MDKIFLLALLAICINSAVIPFDKTAVQQIFQKKNPALFLLTNGNEQSPSAQKAFNAFAQTNPEGVVLSQSDKNDGHGFFDRLAEYLGVNPANVPTVLYLGAKNDKYLYNGEEITADGLATFVQAVNTGTAERFLKSAEPPTQTTGHVKVLVGKTFEDLVLKSDKQVLVKFYAPWCGHCKTLAPHFDEAAERLSNNPNIIIANLDSTLNEVADVEITGYPTLKFWGKDKSQPPIDYNGGRTADGIIQWLKEHTQYEWVEEAEKESTETAEPEEL